jgi:hypothetical protein
LGNLWTGTGLDGRVGLKLDPTGPVGKLLPADWRILNQIEATARVAGSVGALEFDDLSAEIRGPGGSSLSLSGSLEVATPGGVRVERFDLISRLEVMRTDDLAKLLGMDGGGLERFWFEGKLSGDQRRLDADGQAILGETQFDGILSGDFSDVRPSFKGRLHSPHLRLIDLGLMSKPSGDPAPADQGTASAAPLLFGREPFPLGSLQKLDLDLEVQFDHVEGIALAVDRAQAHVTLTDGNLQLAGLRFDVVDGYAEVNAEVDVRQQTPTWRLRARADDVDLGDAWRQLETDVPIGGDLDLVLDLEAIGRSPRDLASSLSGDLSLALQRGQIRSRMFDLTVMNPFHWLVARSARRGYAVIDCFVARFQADRGVAEVLALVLDTTSVIAAGEGYIDFARETLDLRVRPRGKQRSVIQLVTPFAIRGSLANPAVAYSTTGATARTMGRVVASPVNLLGALLPFVSDGGRDRNNPCLSLSEPDAASP